MRPVLLLSLAAVGAAGLLLGSLAPRAESQLVISSACDSIPRELVVSYDTTGGTLTGPLNINLQVHSNGEVKYARSSGLPPNDSMVVEHVSVPTVEVKRLQKALRTAGAFTLCDQNIAVADLPLNTLTVLTGQQDAKAHTFSYYAGFGQGYSQVHAAIQGFIAAHVPNQ